MTIVVRWADGVLQMGLERYRLAATAIDEERGGIRALGVPELHVDASNPDPPSRPAVAASERDGGPGLAPLEGYALKLPNDCLHALMFAGATGRLRCSRVSVSASAEIRHTGKQAE